MKKHLTISPHYLLRKADKELVELVPDFEGTIQELRAELRRMYRKNEVVSLPGCNNRNELGYCLGHN